MLDLVYSGNADSAWELFDGAMVTSWKTKQELRKDFKSTVAGSLFWPELRKMNESPAPAPDGGAN